MNANSITPFEWLFLLLLVFITEMAFYQAFVNLFYGKVSEFSIDAILCFNAQQAAEKALKAVCLAQGIDVPRIHSLVHLMDILETAGMDIPKNVRDADILPLVS